MRVNLTTQASPSRESFAGRRASDGVTTWASVMCTAVSAGTSKLTGTPGFTFLSVRVGAAR